MTSHPNNDLTDSPSGDPTGQTPSQFDTDTAVVQRGPGRWSGFLTPDWNINQNPNGGYAQTPLIKAMAAAAPGHPDPASVTTHFLRPAVAGEAADISVELVRQGRRTSTVRGTMEQQGKVRLESIATFIDLGDPAAEVQTESGAAPRSLDIAPPPIAPPDECVDRVTIHQNVELPLLSRVEVRVDPAGLDDVGTDRAVVRGWMRFQDGHPPDAMALVLLADCFPPSIFSLFGRVGWVPTVELTVQVRRRPRPGWILAEFVTADLAGPTLIEDGVLWDESGAVVAQARQLAMVAN